MPRKYLRDVKGVRNLLKTDLLHSWRWCTNSIQLEVTNGRSWVYNFVPEEWNLVNKAFSYRPVLSQQLDKLIPKQKPAGSTVIPKILQDALNEHLFTGAVVDNVEEDRGRAGAPETGG